MRVRSPLGNRVGGTLLIALAVALIAAACSGGGKDDEESTGSTSTTETTSTGGSVSTLEVPPFTTLEGQPNGGPTQPQETAPPRQPRKIAYPTGGPKGPVFPPGDAAYEMLTAQRCGELLAKTEEWSGGPLGDVPPHQRFLYRSAANACLSNWEAAAAEFDSLAPLGGEFSAGCDPDAPKVQECPSCDQAVLAWLTDVIGAYRSDPDLPPVLTGTAPGAPPC